MSADNRVSAAKNAADNQLYIFPIKQVYRQVFQFILVSHYLFLYFYAPAIRRLRKGIKHCPCPSVRACVLLCVRPSFKLVLCERNSSYNLIPILLKLYRCFCQRLKMCMTFGYNPQISFCHFFYSLNLVIFWAQLLLKLMDIRYLVSTTPPTIFSQSF